MPPVLYHLGKFPPQANDIDVAALSPYVGKANVALGRYDGMLGAIQNANLLLSPLSTHEAVLSSKIEGTRVTMSEMMEIESGANQQASPEQINDTEEIINYRETLQNCAIEVQTREISQHLIRSAHAMLMRGVRGRDKSPGAYRKGQNWIGDRYCSIENASFIPIAPEHLASGMENWEHFTQGESSLDPIVKLAIVHVEFEALHPFEDGNGRLGRMFIPLFLYKNNILRSPSFYMSEFFDSHRAEYQEFMRNVSRNNAWTEWIHFFVTGIEEQAKKNIEKINGILKLYEEMKEHFREVTRSQYHIQALDTIFKTVAFSTGNFCQLSGIPEQTAKGLLRKLTADGILAVRPGAGRRQSRYLFRRLVQVVDPHYG